MVVSNKERTATREEVLIMIKYVGTHVIKDNVELEKLLKEGYSHITEQGYALSDDEDISTDDIVIEDTLCWLYDSMEEEHLFNILTDIN